jgi:Ca-activated chloride channel family protein
MIFELMSFETSAWFLLAILPLLILFFVWSTKGHPVILPLDHSESRSNRYIWFFTNFASMMPALILVVIACILAGPKKQGKPEQEKVLSNIQFCLDASGSMNAMLGNETRYDVAMKAIKKFTEYRKGDSFGLTVFGTNFINWVPVTKDSSAIALATPFLSPRKMAKWFGGTMIGKALGGCREELIKKEDGDRMIILVSDGASSDDVTSAANELKNSNVVVYSIFIGNGSAPYQLHAISSITGGKVFSATNPSGLDETFKHIDKMEKTKFKKSEPKEEDYYYPFSIAGISLLGLYLLSLFGLRYTPW